MDASASAAHCYKGHVSFRSTLDGVRPEDQTGFFDGWPNPPTPETHLRLLRGSDAVVLALDERSAKVIGYIAALTDSVLTPYIGHQEVLPEWRGHGSGSELARRMMNHLKDHYMVDLLCDPEVRPFYARQGMRPSAGMCLRNYARQSGPLKPEPRIGRSSHDRLPETYQTPA